MDKKYDIQSKVITNTKICEDFWQIKLECREIARSIFPGQFVMLRLTQQTDPLFRRPLTVSRIYREEGAIEILYKVVGRGTEIMTGWESGQVCEMLGPLGNGFLLPQSAQTIAVLGRDTGIGPLAALADEAASKGIRVLAFLSAKSSELLDAYKYLEEKCKLFLFPDQGAWRCGKFMTKQLDETAGKSKIDQIFMGGLCSFCPSCSLIKNIHKISQHNQIKAQISLDQYMACGLGACQGCVIELYSCQKQLDRCYKRVCKEGPVFMSWEVVSNG
ncbi:MAG: FAD-binding oxidoreductase [Bacillota bacterium]